MANSIRASCHPDRPHCAKGLCNSCYRAQDRETYNARLRLWRKKNPVKARAIYRRRDLKKLGLTLELYNRLYLEQKGLCLVCDRWEKTLASDHCHVTGKFRGLICGPCNRGIGLLQDNPELLIKAASYLAGDKTTPP